MIAACLKKYFCCITSETKEDTYIVNYEIPVIVKK